MRVLNFFLFGMLPAVHTSSAATVNFSAGEGYEFGPITDNPDWAGSGMGFSVDPSGSGSLSISDDESNKHVFFQKNIKAGSSFLEASILFSFKRTATDSLSDHRNFISVAFNQDPTVLGNRVALILQRFKKNPKLYRFSVVRISNGKSLRKYSKKINESILGFSSSSDSTSDSLELKLKLSRGGDPTSWIASCSIRNLKTGRDFRYETKKFSTDSTFYESDLYPAIGVHDDKAKSLVFEKVIDSFGANPVDAPEETPAPTPMNTQPPAPTETLAPTPMETTLPPTPMETPPPTSPRKKNVLFLVVDDLNDWVGLWNGHPNAVTPNIDRLARMGLRFTNAHCSVPACMPSRASVLSGMRASTTGLYLNGQYWEDSPLLNASVPLPQRFRNNGYYASAVGKIFHRRHPEFWDVDKGKLGTAKPPESARPLSGLDYSSTSAFDWGPLNVENSQMREWKAADYIIDQLRKKSEQPFFLACGFIKPHLPWYAPQMYFDRFPLEEIELPVVNDQDLNDIPQAGIDMALRFGDHEKVKEKEGAWKEGVQGYLASTAVTDDCIGRILDALETHPEKDNTIIVLWSDHGWHLGEKLHWRKFALWEEATRVPMIFVVPGMTTPNTSTDAPVSLLDIYPTLLELAGFPEDPNADGNSLIPLLTDWKYQWPHEAITEHGYKNRSVRTWRWRYILYVDGSEELYDHRNDPMEWTNLANEAGYDEIKSSLRNRLPTSHAPP